MKEFLYDGTFDGLLTAIFYAYPLKYDIKITRSSGYIPSLITCPMDIVTENDKFQRVYSSIENKLSLNTLKNIYYLYLSELINVEDLILRYLRICYKYGDSINMAKNNEIILLVDKYKRRVALEAHRFTGFVRFKEIAPLTFYSSIEPDHNILPLILTHFVERFSDENFIIHDVKRDLAIIYNKKESIITKLSNEKKEHFLNLTFHDDFENLWKEFYKATTIKERTNLNLQKRSMPTRYWKHLVEIDT